MFLMTSILGGCALAVIPIIVHLLHRQKVTPLAWGAMQFLLESPLKVKRRRKIDNLLLMLVRMAILLILALLLARPAIRTTSLTTTTPVDVAVVIDHSMTMGLRTAAAPGQGAAPAAGNGTLFDRGIDVAERVSKMLPSSGTMSIVLAEHSPRVVTPVPLKMGIDARANDGTPRGEWGRDLDMLRKLKPGMTKGNMAPAVASARELLLHGSNTRKIILVVSDHQRTNWEPGEETEWKLALGNAGTVDDRVGGIAVYSMPVNPEQANAGATVVNISVRGISVTPAFLGVHRPAQVFASLTNSGTGALGTVPVQLWVDGKPVSSQSISGLAAGESRTVRFDYYFPQAGSHWIKVRADMVDALEADNEATAAVEVHPKLPVLVVDGKLSGGAAFPAAEFLTAAMQPVDPTIDGVALIDPKVISIAELADSGGGVRLEDYPIVILNDVPRLTLEMANKLAAQAQAGNGVWIILGPRTEQSFINDVLVKSQLAPISAKGIAKAPVAAGGAVGIPAEPVTVDIKEPANGALAVMTASGGSGGEHSALSDVNLRAWWQVVPVAPEMRTVAATTTGDPLMLEMNLGKLGGRVVLWTTPVGDLAWNNIPLMGASFVPLVNETLFHLASGQDAGQPRQIDAGGVIVWTGPNTQPIDSATIVSPDGASRTLQPELRGDHYYVADNETSVPGLYEMRFTAPPRSGAVAPPTAYFSVNIDRAELDPAEISPADVDWFKSHGFLKGVLNDQTLLKAMDATQGGYELWWVLGIFLLGFLLVEVAMTYRLAREQAGASLEEEGLAGVMPAGVVAEGVA